MKAKIRKHVILYRWTAIVSALLLVFALFFFFGERAEAVSAAEGEALTQEEADSASNVFLSDAVEGWPAGPEITPTAAALIDLDTGTFLYGKDLHAQHYPASITKVMTALLAVENGSPDQEVVFSHDAVFNIEAGSANVGMKEGERITLDQALRCLMSASANECAYAIAETIGGTYDRFIEMMNEKAVELGCTDTHFANPHGLYDPTHYVSAHDMALIASEAYGNAWFRDICCLQNYTRPVTEMVDAPWEIWNHHKMFQEGSPYYYEGCTGGKTGWTNEAHNTLVTFAERDGMRLCCIILHGDGQEVYLATSALLDFGFASFEHLPFESCMPAGTIVSAGAGACPIVPKGTAAADVSAIAVQQNGASGRASVMLHGYRVGYGEVTFTESYLKQLEEQQAEEEAQKEAAKKEAGKKTVRRTGFTPGRIMEWVRNRPLPQQIIAGAGLLLVILLIIFFISHHRRKKKRKERRRADELGSTD